MFFQEETGELGLSACLDRDKNTRGWRKDMAKNKESPILLLMI